MPAPIEQAAGTSALESRVLPALELDSAQIAEWDHLCLESEGLASPFLSPHFSRAVAAVKPGVFVAVMTRDGAPVAFLPFQFKNPVRRLLRAGERVGAEMSDSFGVIARPGFRVPPQTLLRLAGLSAFEFTHLDENQRGYGLTGERPEIGLAARLERGRPYWESIRSRDRRFASDTERLERQLQAAQGPLRFVAEEAGGDSLERLMDWKGRQYVKTGRPNLFLAPWRKRLLHELAGIRAETCSGLLSSLYAGDRWVASHFGLRSRAVLHYWFPVYNPEFQRYAPGRLLEKYLLEYAAAQDMEAFDMGAGDTPAKRKISNFEHFYYRDVWYASDLRALAGRAVHAVAWRVEALQG